MTDLEPVTEAQKTVFTADGRDFGTQGEALEWTAVSAILQAVGLTLPGSRYCVGEIVTKADDVKAILERYIAARDEQRGATP